MLSLRFTILTAGMLGGFTCFSAPAAAQDLPKRDDAAFAEVNKLLLDRLIPTEELPRVRPKFLAFAQYYADLVRTPAIYKQSIDPKYGSGLRLKTIDHDPQTGIFTDLDRYILVPVPNGPGMKAAEKADFIREMGIAFNTALTPLIERHPERIVRINEARLMSEVCRSGATALWPTVTRLIKDPNTPTEIKNYALQAAAHLLAAYDPKPDELRARKHMAKNEEVAELIMALTNCILQPEALMKGVNAKDMTTEQANVINFVRRNAVRALAKVRFATFPGPDKKLLYPAYTLAQVCVSDPVLTPPPSPAECIEAALGLCNMAPTWDGKPVKSYNAEAVVEAIAVGLRTFAGARSEPTDHSLPWRHYGILLGEALEGWKPLFDWDFEADKPTNYTATRVPTAVTDLIGRAQTMILVPISKVDAKGMPDPNSRVDIEGLERYLDLLRNKTDRKPLVFTDNPNTVLNSGKK